MALLPLAHHGRVDAHVSRQLRLGHVVLQPPPSQGVRGMHCAVYGSGHHLTVVLLHPRRNSRTTGDCLDIDQTFAILMLRRLSTGASVNQTGYANP